MWYRTGTITLKTGTNKVLGINTKWLDKLSNVEAGQPLIVNNNIYEITEVKSDTELYIKELALEDVTNSAYVIMSVVYGSLGDVALKASKALAHYQEQMQVFDQMYSGTEPFTVIKPDGTEIEMMPYSLLNVSINELNENIQTVASYATNAENSANQAQSSASEAGQYALDASNSAKQSKDSANQSAESASKSLQSANDSASSASNASQSATQAKQSEETAFNHANNAQSSASNSAQSASESKVSAEEAKQAALNATSGFNKDLLIQEFEALSDEEKQAIKDHLGVEEISFDGFMKSENNLKDVNNLAEAQTNLQVFRNLGFLDSENLNLLNTMAHVGVYLQSGNSNAKIEKGYPQPEAGSLLVLPSAYGCIQIYTTFLGRRMFIRSTINSTDNNFSEWTELANLSQANIFKATQEIINSDTVLLLKNKTQMEPFYVRFSDINGTNYAFIGRDQKNGDFKVHNYISGRQLSMQENGKLLYSGFEVLTTENTGAHNGIGSAYSVILAPSQAAPFIYNSIHSGPVAGKSGSDGQYLSGSWKVISVDRKNISGTDIVLVSFVRVS